ncbi:hypothetical protein GCM10007094_05950 [Pseudovibrio japonicus]|uniref:Uncharacterized protein n=1 Tax=Pseudovibrio japonicus TaxID=366534 RepID=A0ABQ3DYR3_9HYPH|nr:hypothetical protein GCM10007094_05950 [Pseudovibrio japonicus]
MQTTLSGWRKVEWRDKTLQQHTARTTLLIQMNMRMPTSNHADNIQARRKRP